MCLQRIPTRTPGRFSVSSTSEAFHPLTDWRPLVGDNVWNFNLLIRDPKGSFRARPGYQYAAVRVDNPDAAVAVGTATSTEGWTHTRVVPPSPGFRFFVRFGVFVSTASGTFGNADVDLEVTVTSRGEIVGGRSIDVQPYNDNAEAAYFIGTPWIPTVGVIQIQAAQISTDNADTTTRTRLAYRTANDEALPSSWSLVGSWTAVPVGNGERTTGSNASGIDASANRLQLGWAVDRTGGAISRAGIWVAFGIVRSFS